MKTLVVLQLSTVARLLSLMSYVLFVMAFIVVLRILNRNLFRHLSFAGFRF